jgi:hypothetical protein
MDAREGGRKCGAHPRITRYALHPGYGLRRTRGTP